MLVFEEGGKPENPGKTPRRKGENQQQTQPTHDAWSGNRTRDTLVGGVRSHHCAIPAPAKFRTKWFNQNEACKETFINKSIRIQEGHIAFIVYFVRLGMCICVRETLFTKVFLLS